MIAIGTPFNEKRQRGTSDAKANIMVRLPDWLYSAIKEEAVALSGALRADVTINELCAAKLLRKWEGFSESMPVHQEATP